MISIPIPLNGIVVDTVFVRSEWIDYNGHMNVAWFVKAFELGIDSYKAVVGLDAAYIEANGRSTVALEAHIRYQREAVLGDELRIETRLLGCDGKRVHVYQEMYRGSAMLATQETLAISFDLAARRVCAFEPAIADRYRRMVAAQTAIDRPAWVGRAITLDETRA